MKNVILIISFCFLGLVGYAQQPGTDVEGAQIQELDSECIIVLDDTRIGENIDNLLRGNALHGEESNDNSLHELVHSAPNTFTLEGRLVEGGFSYS